MGDSRINQTEGWCSEWNSADWHLQVYSGVLGEIQIRRSRASLKSISAHVHDANSERSFHDLNPLQYDDSRPSSIAVTAY
ncbi:hypothetical protein IAQ61_010822 [Plenodomus lingam]|uniref:uncharacterized protein n=1 Tax=Leptosphaeria maculans TaxID=5022 RepID=UPI003316E92A|nr:hypothetical protein IAQ61_010822 [Plenodomus lingam]